MNVKKRQTDRQTQIITAQSAMCDSEELDRAPWECRGRVKVEQEMMVWAAVFQAERRERGA